MKKDIKKREAEIERKANSNLSSVEGKINTRKGWFIAACIGALIVAGVILALSLTGVF